jgi:hypothetical protein
MDKKILERACVVFQLLGYGYFIYELLYYLYLKPIIWDLWSLGIYPAAYTVPLDIVIPLLTRWCLTGKFKILPIMSKSEED